MEINVVRSADERNDNQPTGYSIDPEEIRSIVFFSEAEYEAMKKKVFYISTSYINTSIQRYCALGGCAILRYEKGTKIFENAGF